MTSENIIRRYLQKLILNPIFFALWIFFIKVFALIFGLLYRKDSEEIPMEKRRLKKFIKKYLNDFVEQNGFMEYGGYSLIRISNRILQKITFNISRDNYDIEFHLSIMPLYILEEFPHISFGGGMKHFTGEGGQWYSVYDDKHAEKYFKKFLAFLETDGLKWFEKMKSSKSIIENKKKYPKDRTLRPEINMNYEYAMGYIALDAGDYEEAVKWFNIYLGKGKGDERDWVVKKVKGVEKLLNNINNPDLIKEILDANLKQTVKNLGLEKYLSEN